MRRWYCCILITALLGTAEARERATADAGTPTSVEERPSARNRLGLGDSVAKRRPQFTPGIRAVVGALTEFEVGRVVLEHRKELRSCYEPQLGKAWPSTVYVTVTFDITSTGEVQSAQQAVFSMKTSNGSSLKNSDVDACVLARLRLWKFPEPRDGGVVYVNYPIVMQTQD